MRVGIEVLPVKIQRTKSGSAVLPPAFGAIKQKLELKLRQLGRPKIVADAEISVPTLVRIRSGHFPWLEPRAPTPSVRQVVAWARTLTRLANVLEEKPLTLIKATGLDMAAERRSAVQQVNDAVDREWQNLQDKGKGLVPVAPREVDIIRRIRTDKTVRVAILDQRPFSVPVHGTSFFAELSERLVGTINPNWRIREWESPAGGLPNQIEPLIKGLAKNNPECDFGVGLFETVDRRLEGLDFIPIPGWRISLGALWIGRGSDAAAPPRWDDIVSPANRDHYKVVVIDGEAGALYMKGHCRYSAESIVEVAGVSDFNAIADAIQRAHGSDGRDVVFVADEETCYWVRRTLEKSGRTMEKVQSGSTSFPTYPLSIVFKFGDSQWRELLRAAMQDELFGNALGATAAMYARVMGQGALDHVLDGQKPESTWQPNWFELRNDVQTSEFWVTLYDRLFGHIASEVKSKDVFRRRHLDAETEIHRICCSALPDELKPLPDGIDQPLKHLRLPRQIHGHVARSIQFFQSRLRQRSVPAGLLLSELIENKP